MDIQIIRMNQKYAVEALCWKYEKPYDFYNHVLTTGAIAELLGNRYYAMINEERELIGFFCLGRSAQVPAGDRFGVYNDDCIDLGLGMKPEYTGKGYGTIFLSHILNHVYDTCPLKDIRLTVATFNHRAIRLYENHGFIKQQKFLHKDTDFITMIKYVS
ncbi:MULTISPECIES: GNAT family protein [Oceanobacillus]|uniref:N-acetyltransferase n=1 Tax=Oceanobacillus kimchii TaxID=746691 RepID=A0ABQ5TG91_9BACI|nr:MULTISPECIES: GNAT family protein [Oceanobacillus]MBT2599260.1 GNAT family N-acetyltransferase [Oceanobacillus sp. ISL-74]MBT2652178.1 GNAT family N-acetyltransferase [Oceanobacillus sp. ISL-73]MCT1578540.1 GNAT family N-acetyltransferase [Oceanobacillus kimchii]MCT2136411.1 GNAT family N-acetyltransferase [Oceanobacillus kimchii]OEH54181.1 acetyltransferase [Oceanobacillus sp. E9]